MVFSLVTTGAITDYLWEVAVAKATVVAFDGKLLVIGGIDSKAVLEYNPANDKWKTLPHLLGRGQRCGHWGVCNGVL